MPYIDPKIREFIDKDIDELAKKIATRYEYESKGGILNYIIFRLALKFMGSRSYSSSSLMKSAMTDCAEEWYRRVMAPYEDEKIIQNGDVDGMTELNS